MTLILITCQQQGRPFDYYYYVKVFKDILLFLCPSKGVFAIKIPPPNENPPIPSVLSHVSVSELYMLYTG